MLPGDMSTFINLIKRDWSFPALVLSIFGLALTQWVHLSYPLVLGLGLTLFSAWDVIGYESVARSDKREYNITMDIFMNKLIGVILCIN